jgi:TRAP-type C4-dicarboxylate transport system permease small subunit
MNEATEPPHRTGLERVLDALAMLCKLVTGTALVVLTLIFGWLVWGRYVMNDTPTWVEQAALLLVMLITFLGAAVGIHESTHLGVSYFREIASARIRVVFTVITHLILAVFGAVMAWQSYALVLFKWGSEIPLIHLPEGLRAVPIMLAGGLIMIFSIGHLIAIARGEGSEGSLAE